MAVTNYITANGMLVGEMTGGVMTAYGPDALGSVVATYSGTSLQNTYQYKPYGATLAKTGTAADPKFLWNGGSGYRATSLAFSSFYVRRRHFATSPAIWTTSDPVWPNQRAYGYASGRTVLFSDPSGLAPQRVPAGGFRCGCARLSIEWMLNETGSVDPVGWIVQEVNININLYTCDYGRFYSLHPCENGTTYYEAFPVVFGEGYLLDTWSFASNDLYCSFGSITYTASFQYYKVLPAVFYFGGPNKVACSGEDQLSSYLPPPGYVGEPGSEANVVVTWGCCSANGQSPSPPPLYGFIESTQVCCTGYANECFPFNGIATYNGGSETCSETTIYQGLPNS